MNLLTDKTLLETNEEKNFQTLVSETYKELRRLAAYHLKNERVNHTLQPTELVHEVYLLLQRQHSLDLNNRGAFVSLASTIMRRVLVNYARKRNRIKRGAGRENVDLDNVNENTMIDFGQEQIDVIALEESLTKLAKRDPRQVKIIELYFFGGLTFEEIAGVLGVSRRTVMNDWRFARSWLYQDLKNNE